LEDDTFLDHVELLCVMMEADVNSVRKQTQLVCLKMNESI